MNGADIGQRIRKRIRDVEAEHARLTQASTGVERALEDKRRERETLVHRLSALYLPQLDRKSLDFLRDRLPELHDRVEAILSEKRREIEALDRRIEENRRERTELGAQTDSLAQKLEAKAEERDALEDRVDSLLDADEAYHAAVLATKQSRERLLQNQRRLEAAVTERDEKVPEYDGDLFFAYLHARQFATAAYRPRGLTARLDGWVAGLTGYRDQSQNYRLLLEVPDVVSAAVAASQQDLQSTASQVDRLVTKVMRSVGLPQVIAEGEALFDERTRQLARIEAIDSSFESMLQQRTELEKTRGQYYEQALAEYQRFLQGESVASLRKLALSTETRADDGITSLLDTVSREIPELESQLADRLLQRRQIADQLNELLKLDQEFHRKNYDASNSTFGDGLDIDSILAGILAGASTVEAALRLLGRSHRFLRVERMHKAESVADILWTVAGIGIEVARASGHGADWIPGDWGGGKNHGHRGSGGGSNRGFRGFGGGGGSRTTGGFG